MKTTTAFADVHASLSPSRLRVITRLVPTTRWVSVSVSGGSQPNSRTSPGARSVLGGTLSHGWLYGGIVSRTVVRLVPGSVGDRLTARGYNPSLTVLVMPASKPNAGTGNRATAYRTRFTDEEAA